LNYNDLAEPINMEMNQMKIIKKRKEIVIPKDNYYSAEIEQFDGSTLRGHQTRPKQPSQVL
jgi:hypothetical protein